MEEDIKILEEFFKRDVEFFKNLGERAILQDNEIQAIENLIKRNKELEEELKHKEQGELIKSNLIEKIIEKIYIPKSKVREKIEELDSIYQQEIKQKYNGRYYHQLSYAIQILKELEGDDK